MTSTSLQAPPAVIGPGHDEWDRSRATFNLLDDLAPTGFTFPRDAEEVAASVRDAVERGLAVAVQATGHNAGTFRSLDDVLIVNTSLLDEVDIDAATGRVRVGGGVKWERVTQTLSDLGYAGLHGSSPDVGIAGYSLGGGIGWLARKHGLQTNAVTAIEVVTADGKIRRVDHDNDPDLFWALRGGNGNFGVVTAVEFSTVRAPQIYSGALFFPVERTAEVLHTWRAALPSFPEEMTTWVSVIHFPPDPALPELVRGRSMVILMAAHLGDEREGRALLAPFQTLGPVADTLAMQPPMALAELAMDPVDPLPYRSTTALLDELTAEAADELARVAGADSPLALLQVRHGGGALNRVPDGSGARATLPGEVIVFGLGVVPDPEQGARVLAALDEIDAAVAGNSVGWYPNFVERPADARAFFPEETWQRLQAVKRAFDPNGLFLGNHHIPGA